MEQTNIERLRELILKKLQKIKNDNIEIQKIVSKKDSRWEAEKERLIEKARLRKIYEESFDEDVKSLTHFEKFLEVQGYR